MAQKTKSKSTTDTINEMAANTGILLMAAATTLGLTEVPHDPDKRIVLPNQPAFAVAHDVGNAPGNGHELRRERDEVHPHAAGYGVNHRTPARSGRA